MTLDRVNVVSGLPSGSFQATTEAVNTMIQKEQSLQCLTLCDKQMLQVSYYDRLGGRDREHGYWNQKNWIKPRFLPFPSYVIDHLQSLITHYVDKDVGKQVFPCIICENINWFNFHGYFIGIMY